MKREITFTLFDFTDEEAPKRMVAAVGYDDTDPLGYGPLKVTIGVGDPVAVGTITLPLQIIMAGMANLMQAHENATRSSLVGFDKPNLIVPN